MTQPGRIVRFAVLAFGILLFDSAAFGQQSQSWKFPLSIPTTQSGYPSPVVASTGPLAVGTYSITAKTSLQNLYSAREPSGKCFLVLLEANGNVISGSQLDETDVTLDETSNFGARRFGCNRRHFPDFNGHLLFPCLRHDLDCDWRLEHGNGHPITPSFSQRGA